MSVSRGKVGNSQHFPTNLHVLLDEAEKGNHSHIVSWCSQGQAFKIHDQDALVPLLAKYFRQTKFKSFLRQLQSYDFHRTTRKGCDKGIVSHPLFIRGRRSLCFRMSRKPTGSSSISSQSQTLPPKSPSSEINMNMNMNINMNNCYPAEAVPSNKTIPLRKINSAPIFGAKRNRVATNLSEMNNEMFQNEEEQNSSLREGIEPSLHHHEPQHQHNQNLLVGEGGDIMMRKSCSAPQIGERSRFKRRASASATMAISTHAPPYAKPQTKRPSASAILISNEQRESIIQCANIDYSSSNNAGRIPHENFILPHEAFLMSIKESSAADGVVTTSQSPQVIPAHIVQSTNQQLQQQAHQVQQQQNCEQPVQYQVQLMHQQQKQQQPQVQQMQQIVEQLPYQQHAKVDQQVQKHHQQQMQPHQQVQVQHVQYLQEQQQQQQQQQQQDLQLKHQHQPQHQIEQVQMQYRQDNQQVYAQYQQEPQQQHQVEDHYQQEPQQVVYGQHQVPNQVQQVKQPVEQMSYAQQQLQDHYQSACQVQQIQQQQQQQQYSSQNQNHNVQYQRSQCEQQQQNQNEQVGNQQIQYGQHQHCEQHQDSQQYRIVQNQQEVHQHPQQQVREFTHVQNSPVEPQQLSSTGFSNSGCDVHPGSPVRSHQPKPQEQARQLRHVQNSHVEPQQLCSTGFSDSNCHVLPGSPVRSHQPNPSKGNQDMLPVSLALCGALLSNETDVSFSSTQFKSCGNDNNNGSNGRILPALKLSTSYNSRGGGGGGNLPLSSSSYLIDKVKITGTTSMVNNHSNTANNHQDVTLPDISLSVSQHTAHPLSTMPHSNGNDEYRTMLQLPTSETFAPQHNAMTTIVAASPFLSQQHDQQQGGGGFLKADVASHGCTQPHSNCDVATTAAPSFTDGGTVDSLLLLNGGGCEEWEMSFEDFKGI